MPRDPLDRAFTIAATTAILITLVLFIAVDPPDPPMQLELDYLLSHPPPVDTCGGSCFLEGYVEPADTFAP